MARQQPDSAFAFFSQAYTQGMPKDSFFYFWAEVFLDRGAGDSAFVVNNAIVPPRDSAFRYQVLEQRYLIYSSLGWKDKANSIIDSLASSDLAIVKAKNRWYLPKIALYLGGGLNDVRECSRVYPFPSALEYNRVWGPDYRGEIKARWWLSVGNDWTLQPSIGYLLINQGRRTLSRDSLGNTLAASMGIDWRGFCNASYTWRKTSNVDQPPSFIHTFAINFFPGIGKDRMLFLYGGYSMMNSTENTNHGKMATLLAYGSANFPNKHTFSLSVTGTGQWFPSQSIEYPMPMLDVDDVTKAPGAVVHYEANDPSTPIPGDDPIHSLDNYRNNAWANLTYFEEFYPGTNYLLTSDCDYALPLPWRLTGILGVGYLLQRYAQPYVWYSINPQKSEDYSHWEYQYQIDSLWVAHNRKDGQYYLSQEPIPGSGFIADTFSTSPYDILQAKIRTDQTISARIGISRDFGRPGNLRLTYQISKTFSTLSQEAPVKIPVWSQNLSFRWVVNLSFR
jgi:hypothetical protein